MTSIKFIEKYWIWIFLILLGIIILFGSIKFNIDIGPEKFINQKNCPDTQNCSPGPIIHPVNNLALAYAEQEFNDKYQKLENQERQIDDKYNKLNSEYANIQVRLQNLNKELNNERQQLASEAKALVDLQGKYANVNIQLGKYRGLYKDTDKKYKDCETSLKNYKANLGNENAQIAAYEAEIDTLKTTYDTVAKEMNDFKTKLSDCQSKSSAYVKRIGNMEKYYTKKLETCEKNSEAYIKRIGNMEKYYGDKLKNSREIKNKFIIVDNYTCDYCPQKVKNFYYIPNIKTCENLCIKNKDKCVGFNYKSSTKECHLKSEITPNRVKKLSNWQFGIKI